MSETSAWLSDLGPCYECAGSTIGRCWRHPAWLPWWAMASGPSVTNLRITATFSVGSQSREKE